MKISRFLMAFLMLLPFLQACQDDITDLDDPRDAIAKEWRVTESGQSYSCRIYKDATETTRVYFGGNPGFHALQLSNKLYATLAGKTLTISSQTIDGYAISGTGTIASDLKSITFNYTVKAGTDPAEDFTAEFGEVVVKKKATVKASL